MVAMSTEIIILQGRAVVDRNSPDPNLMASKLLSLNKYFSICCMSVDQSQKILKDLAYFDQLNRYVFMKISPCIYSVYSSPPVLALLFNFIVSLDSK